MIKIWSKISDLDLTNVFKPPAHPPHDLYVSVAETCKNVKCCNFFNFWSWALKFYTDLYHMEISSFPVSFRAYALRKIPKYGVHRHSRAIFDYFWYFMEFWFWESISSPKIIWKYAQSTALEFLHDFPPKNLFWLHLSQKLWYFFWTVCWWLAIRSDTLNWHRWTQLASFEPFCWNAGDYDVETGVFRYFPGLGRT